MSENDYENAPLEYRVKVLCENAHHSIYPKPDMKYFLNLTVNDFKCDGIKPDFFDKIEVGKKIHLQTQRDLYNLEEPEAKAFWERLDELLRTKSSLIFFIRAWKPASNKAYPRKSGSIEGDFIFDYCTAPCITM